MAAMAAVYALIDHELSRLTVTKQIVKVLDILDGLCEGAFRAAV